MLVCLEHAEEEIDRIVEEEERAPELVTLDQAGITGEAACRICGQPAEYSIN